MPEYDEEVDWGSGETDKENDEEEKEELIVVHEEVIPAERDASPAKESSDKICPSCGNERARGLMACTSCGHSWGYVNTRAKERAMMVRERTKLEIVYVTRGARTENGAVRRKFRSYWRTATEKFGYKSVAQRFTEDKVFQKQMMEQGRNFLNILDIDEGANSKGKAGRRSRAQIEGSGRYVYRGKPLAAEDEAWDEAHLYAHDQVSEYRHWCRFKKRRAERSPPPASYPSSSWSTSRWNKISE